MKIGAYTFDEFRKLAENFHGYAAPGLLIGAYMVEKARAALPAGTLFEAVAESNKCLPDAVQLLTPCTIGNQRLKIDNLGRYAVSLFDKYSGKGWRVSLDPEKMRNWPEMYDWFFKIKPKRDQDSKKLEEEIRQAGDSICRIEPVIVQRKYVGSKHMGAIGVCPMCQEAYPVADGPICRGCQGEAPYVPTPEELPKTEMGIRIVPVEEATGEVAAHDMTRIVPEQFKGPEFRAGQRISAGDVCRLQTMGRFHVAVADAQTSEDEIHENVVATAFAEKMAGPGVEAILPPREGKVDLKAAHDGVLCIDLEKLRRFNLLPDVMVAVRHDGSLLQKGTRFAGTRAIPLFLDRHKFEIALDVLAGEPLFEVRALRKARAGILVTGTEVFKGLIEDKFIPIITSKVLNLGGEILCTSIVPDDIQAIRDAIRAMLAQGVDIIFTTGGLSVDPDDVTRQALLECGLQDVVHGVPVLPGTMSVAGKLEYDGRTVQVVGVPACALYHRTTFLDLILPRLLCGRDFTHEDAARMAEGGYCMGCKVCTWPKCPFGK